MIPVFKRKKSKLQEFLSHQIRLQLECMVSKLGDISAYVSDKETRLGEVELSMLREELNHCNMFIQNTIRKHRIPILTRIEVDNTEISISTKKQVDKILGVVSDIGDYSDDKPEYHEAVGLLCKAVDLLGGKKDAK